MAPEPTDRPPDGYASARDRFPPISRTWRRALATVGGSRGAKGRLDDDDGYHREHGLLFKAAWHGGMESAIGWCGGTGSRRAGTWEDAG